MHWLNKRDAAIADFTRALTLDPGSDEAYYMRGRTWSQKARYPDAIADFTECLQIAPTRVDAYVARGETFVSRANRPNNKPAKTLLYLNSAIADLDRAISLTPRNSNAYGWRARAHRSAERLDASIANFTKSLRLCSEAETRISMSIAPNLLRQMDAVAKRGSFDLAIADLSVAVRAITITVIGTICSSGIIWIGDACVTEPRDITQRSPISAKRSSLAEKPIPIWCKALCGGAGLIYRRVSLILPSPTSLRLSRANQTM